MYSPKINENLIPALYQLAKNKGIHMTQLVDLIIADAIRDAHGESKVVIAGEDLSPEQVQEV